MRDNQISAEDLADVAGITNLKNLCLANCSVENGALQNLKSLEHLEVLDISKNILNPAKIKEIAQLPALITLDLSSSNVNDQALADLANVLPHLQHIDLRNTMVTEKE